MSTLLAFIFFAQIVIPVKVVDFVGDSQRLGVYQNSKSTLTIQLKNHGSIVDGTDYVPYFYIASSGTNRTPIAGICAWQTQTSSIFTVTYSSNNFPVTSRWIYGCGLSNAMGITTFSQGPIDIKPDPWR